MHDSRQHNHKSIYSPRKDFTLIEILLVVSVMLIVLAFTTPIFSELLRGNAVDEAASMISSQLALARAQATRFRKPVALVFPIENQADNTFKTLAYTTCRPCFANKPSSNWEFDKWLPNSEWKYIPLGAIIAQVDDSYKDELEYHPTPIGVPPEVNDKPTWEITENWLESKDFPYKETNTENRLVYNVELLKQISETETEEIKEEKIRAIIFFPDGSSSEAMYVTLAEGVTFMQGDPSQIGKINEKRVNRTNLRVLKINPYTGKANFIY